MAFLSPVKEVLFVTDVQTNGQPAPWKIYLVIPKFRICSLSSIPKIGKNFDFKPGMVAHAFNPGTWEAEAGGSL